MQGKMPPWFAHPQFGHFSNDARLSPRYARTIAEWVDTGAQQGDPIGQEIAMPCITHTSI